MSISSAKKLQEFEPLSVVVRTETSLLTIDVSGELDELGWPALDEVLRSCLVVDVPCVDLQLDGVSFLSSGAWRILYGTLCELRAAGRHVVITPSRPVARLIQLFADLGGRDDDATSFLAR